MEMEDQNVVVDESQKRESESWVVTSQIVQLLRWQIEAVIPTALVSNAIVPFDQEEQSYGSQCTHPHKPKAHPKSQLICWRLTGGKDVGSDEADTVADRKLDGGADASLVVSCQIVVEPHNRDWLHKPAPASDEVQAEVSGTCRYTVHR